MRLFRISDLTDFYKKTYKKGFLQNNTKDTILVTMLL